MNVSFVQQVSNCSNTNQSLQRTLTLESDKIRPVEHFGEQAEENLPSAVGLGGGALPEWALVENAKFCWLSEKCVTPSLPDGPQIVARYPDVLALDYSGDKNWFGGGNKPSNL